MGCARAPLHARTRARGHPRAGHDVRTLRGGPHLAIGDGGVPGRPHGPPDPRVRLRPRPAVGRAGPERGERHNVRPVGGEHRGRPEARRAQRSRRPDRVPRVWAARPCHSRRGASTWRSARRSSITSIPTIGARELARVLAPGGKATFSEPLGTNPLVVLARAHLPYPGKHERGADRPLTVNDIAAWRAPFAEVPAPPNPAPEHGRAGTRIRPQDPDSAADRRRHPPPRPKRLATMSLRDPVHAEVRVPAGGDGPITVTGRRSGPRSAVPGRVRRPGASCFGSPGRPTCRGQ